MSDMNFIRQDCYRQLSDLREQYRLAAEPIIRILIDIQDMEPVQIRLDDSSYKLNLTLPPSE